MYTVLLVDDEPIAAEGLMLMIDWEGFGFRVAGIYHTGQDAFEHISRDPPDLVVTDIRMPLMDGLEMIEQTRQRGNTDTQFVLTSGYNDFHYARRALHLGVTSYLVKPILDREAREVLDGVLSMIRDKERQVRIQESAGRYAVDHSLSVLVFGGDEEAVDEAKSVASSWAGEAEGWTYIHVDADEADRGCARETARNLAESTPFCRLIDRDPDAFGLVLGWRHPAEPAVRSFADRLLALLRERSEGRPRIAVGCGVKRLEELVESAAGAAEAERFLFFGKTDIVYYDEIRDRTLTFDPEILKLADGIVDIVESGRGEALSDSILGALRTFESDRIAPELISIFLIQVVLRCASLYKEMGGDSDELLLNWGMDQKLRKGLNLSDAGVLLVEFCLQCQSACASLLDRRSGGAIRKAADYLRLHYAEPSTIKEIAERLFVNPVYLGQSFSRKFGIGILDFIHDLRINEAVNRLQGTDEPLSSIAESVGYRGYQQFLKQFEKRLGMKPAEFRSRERNNGLAGDGRL
ncbi:MULTISPECIES: response regulator [Paenibacillus]|uniref:response regulator transcription factor n=1 Tax=Paenibacillus TaxID=44249 RepID=UPI00043221B5|nr:MULTISPECIES: response regulator [Paenibacillus]CDN44708.1 YesN14 [Paenibacillus sp. P22]